MADIDVALFRSKDYRSSKNNQLQSQAAFPLELEPVQLISIPASELFPFLILLRLGEMFETETNTNTCGQAESCMRIIAFNKDERKSLSYITKTL